MHPINGTWKIIAHSPMGEMPSINEIKVEGDGFTGVMHDERSGRDYDIVDGRMDGNRVTFGATMKFGFISMTFAMEGIISEDGRSCTGTAKAMKMEGTFEGVKISD